MKKTLPGLLASLLALSASTAQADILLEHWENHREPPQAISLSPEVRSWTSSNNYATDGSTYIPANLDQYSRLELDANASYGITSWLTAYGRLSWAHVQLKSSNASELSGLADQTLGVNLHVWDAKSTGQIVPASLDAQFQADFPAYKNSVSRVNFTPYLGNGSSDFTAGGFLTIPLQQTITNAWTLTGGAGFMSRSGGYSAGLPWSFKLDHVEHFAGLTASIAMGGYQSLGSDPLTNVAISNLNPAGSGGSFVTSSVNPALLDIHGGLGYRFDPKLSIALDLEKSFFGKSAPSLFAVGASMTAHWDWGKRSNPLMQTPTEYGKSNRGFVAYEFEAKVTKTSDRLNSIKIDKGSSDGVAPGQVFDVFVIKANGEAGGVVARAQVSVAKPTEASLIILEYFKEVWIEEGFIVKRPL